MFYLVSTPIGNLADMTYRGVEILKSVDYILCEDTRHSLVLLKRYEIQKPLKSYHKFNEAKTEEAVLADLRKGLNVALITDAGTPGISDPGTRLVRACIKEGLSVEAIPGPCAVIQALVCSGLDTSRFQFLGFSPKQKKALHAFLQEALNYPGTSIFYVSPHQILSCLKAVCELNREVQVAVGRELTKKFEEWQRGSAQEVVEKISSSPLKGEFVVLISAQEKSPTNESSLPLLIEEMKQLMLEKNLTQQEAMKQVAKSHGIPKRTIYQEIHREKR